MGQTRLGACAALEALRSVDSPLVLESFECRVDVVAFADDADDDALVQRFMTSIWHICRKFERESGGDWCVCVG